MSLPSSPGKMDLSALGGLKRRVLQPVPDVVADEPAVTVQPEQPAQPEQLTPAPEAAPAAAPDTEQETAPEETAQHPAETAPEAAREPEMQAEAGQKAAQPVAEPVGERADKPAAAAKIEPVEEEHSGHVTLYLPKDLNQWMAEHHDSTDISYPGIVLNAISWAAAENRFAEIFAPADSPIPANDIFGRAPAIAKPARGSVEPETRPVRFRKDHMKVIISLARTWTADNRNAFFVGVLNAYRTELTKGS